MTSSRGDKIVLSYKDALIRKSDLDLLQPGAWINDAILSFWFEYLLGEMYPSAQQLITLVGPEVSHLLKLAPNDEFSGLLSSVQSTRFVLLALNNQTDPEAAGGSHWSLLAYDTVSPDEPLVHFDSSNPSNHSAASVFARRLNRPLEEAVVPQQENTCDCGLYVAIYAEVLCRCIGSAAQDPVNLINIFPPPEAILEITPEMASRKRQEITDLILVMGRDGQSDLKNTML